MRVQLGVSETCQCTGERPSSVYCRRVPLCWRHCDQRPCDQRPGDQRPCDQRSCDQRPCDQRPCDQRPCYQRHPITLMYIATYAGAMCVPAMQTWMRVCRHSLLSDMDERGASLGWLSDMDAHGASIGCLFSDMDPRQARDSMG